MIIKTSLTFFLCARCRSFSQAYCTFPFRLSRFGHLPFWRFPFLHSPFSGVCFFRHPHVRIYAVRALHRFITLKRFANNAMIPKEPLYVKISGARCYTASIRDSQLHYYHQGLAVALLSSGTPCYAASHYASVFHGSFILGRIIFSPGHMLYSMPHLSSSFEKALI